ncbi:Uncharacterized conserved protein YdeI, YjbR/CyaY-like superfamily, DUF1801 family [Loktanella atrilutea]|uniref:Uncharacterized conserved protein YdeI, YjbR/CyaY-like superfamily, DUF1801 family n=1 Tax=Loktanella atrilutea TaxID=366533 RepID=A0A1M5AM32_LOKAT|nr:YdeI/OmpD-associated family protein [Loktanella atrilutea]SHF31331.1 Uncharacterized conserved protein YdeI, YjbR/CyaY-like superfamily, DUF1801 family [Loktanella atrilutea]
MTKASDFEQVEVASEDELRDWLAAHHHQHQSVWLISFKAGDDRYLAYDTIVRQLVAHGWVDSRPRSLDAARSMRLISLRRPGSNWSRANRQRAEDLITSGQMTPRGQAAVDSARADGSWTALVDIEDGVVPDDLAAMLRDTPHAQGHFDAFPPSSRRIILEWIAAARTDATRRKRVQQTAEMASRNERANHYRS